MMFDTLQGLTIPEGVVTQIAKDGVVLWAVQSDKSIILEVEKITSNTYVSSTSYTDEQFLQLDIYPKTSDSIVEVTYGGLTKTLTFNGTNAQQVYFGTFGGVSDAVETPVSGTLTITGDCIGVGAGSYNTAKNTSTYCKCITGITEWGGITYIAPYMLYNCAGITLSELPSGITSIGASAFYGCSNITLSELPSGITSIEERTFYGCTGITSIIIPAGVITIGGYAFYGCTSLISITIPASVTTIEAYAFVNIGSDGNLYLEITEGWSAGNTVIHLSTPAKAFDSLYTSRGNAWTRS